MNEYAALPLLKSALGDIADTDRDDLLNLALDAASRDIDAHCSRRFYLDASASARVYRIDRRLVREFDGDRVLIDDVGDVTGLIVEVGNATDGWSVITPAVETEPENAAARGRPVTSVRHLRNRIPCDPYARLRVTAVWGWPAVPPQIEQATLIQAARLFKRKDSPEGVLGSAEWGTVRLSRLDPDAARLVEMFVLDGFA